MISLESIRLQRGSSVLLEQASVRLQPARKIALIGANGTGKSSLFEMLMGRLQPDSGDLFVPPAWRIAHMAQEVAASERSAFDHVLDGDSRLRDIEAAIARCER